MATEKEITEHLAVALEEVGLITPWFDQEVDCWVFEHSSYPVSYGGESSRDVIKNYPLYLREFIKERLKNNLDPMMEKATKGKGGIRAGAGRPKGTRGVPSKQIRVPIDIAEWLKQPGIIAHLRQVMRAYHPA